MAAVTSTAGRRGQHAGQRLRGIRRPGPARAGRLRGDDVLPVRRQRRAAAEDGRGGRLRAGPLLRRPRPAARRHVGVRQGQHVRRAGVHLLRRLLAVLLVPGHPPADRLGQGRSDTAVGVYLLVWTIFTAYMLAASLRTSGAIMAVFLFLTLTFLFLAVGAYGGHREHDQDRRLARADHRRPGLVRLVRRRVQRDREARGPADHAAGMTETLSNLLARGAALPAVAGVRRAGQRRGRRLRRGRRPTGRPSGPPRPPG